MLNLLLDRSVFAGAIREENGSHVGTLNISKLSPVCLLLFQGLFMLLDQVFLVVSYGTSGDQADLLTALHNLRVDVETGHAITLEPALRDEVLKINAACLVDLIRIWICAFG